MSAILLAQKGGSVRKKKTEKNTISCDQILQAQILKLLPIKKNVFRDFSLPEITIFVAFNL